jgi:hypothetical protein
VAKNRAKPYALHPVAANAPMTMPRSVANTIAVSALRTSGTVSSGCSSLADHVAAGNEAASDRPSITKKLTPGIAKARPTSGGSPASAARRTDMLTPIQKNGSVIRPRPSSSALGACGNCAIRTLQTGER